jgi:predicted  nucleic acid-binding Zn-ribbon protein
VNKFIVGVVVENLAKLKEDKEEVDDKIRTLKNELDRLFPIQKAMENDIKDTEAWLKSSQVSKVVTPKGK